MSENIENGGAAYLPAQGFGFHAAKINVNGGKEPLSTAIYDSPEEAEAGARSILMSIEAHEKRAQKYEDMVRKQADAMNLIFSTFGMAVVFGGGVFVFLFPLSRRPGDVAEIAGYFFLFVAAICLVVSIRSLLNKDLRRAAFGKIEVDE